MSGKVELKRRIADDRVWMELDRTVQALTGRSIEDLGQTDWESLAASISADEFDAAKEYCRLMRMAVAPTRESLVVDSKPRNKDEQLWIRIESRVKRQLERLAEIEGLKLAEYVRRAVTALASQGIPTPEWGGSEEQQCEHKQK